MRINNFSSVFLQQGSFFLRISQVRKSHFFFLRYAQIYRLGSAMFAVPLRTWQVPAGTQRIRDIDS